MRRTVRITVTSALVLALVACEQPAGSEVEPGIRPTPPTPGQPGQPGQPLPGAWSSLAPLPEARAGASATTLGGIVYLTSGPHWTASPLLAGAVFAYNPAENTWRTAGHLAPDVRYPGLAAADARIYAMGGWQGHRVTALLQVLDPATGLVTQGPEMPTRRAGMAVAEVGGRIHVIGGYIEWDAIDVDYLDAHEVFDPATGAWSTRAPLPYTGSIWGAAVVGGKVYVAGEAGLQIYDPTTNSWSFARTNVTQPAWSSRAVAGMGGKVYLIGGGRYPGACCDGPTPQAGVERFDPESGRWEEVSPLPAARVLTAAAAVGEAVYVLGGYSIDSTGVPSRANERLTP